MRTAEFEAEVKNGTIEIPSEYRKLFGNSVRVKLSSSDEPAPEPSLTILDKWMASPILIADFQPLSREQAHER